MIANFLPLPPLGLNPSTAAQGTTPGSFATRPVIESGVAGAKTFASPDTPGMPAPSDKTAWDFLPEGWSSASERPGLPRQSVTLQDGRDKPGRSLAEVVFKPGDGPFR